MDMAERFGQTSEAVRLKVGALIVKGDSIIAQGVNGMPPKWPSEICEDHVLVEPRTSFKDEYTLVTKPQCRHAEIAALEKLWKSPETAEGAVMFVSHSPCEPCAIKIQTAGITKVYYRHAYRESAGIDFLRRNKIEVIKLN